VEALLLQERLHLGQVGHDESCCGRGRQGAAAARARGARVQTPSKCPGRVTIVIEKKPEDHLKFAGHSQGRSFVDRTGSKTAPKRYQSRTQELSRSRATAPASRQ
jgi:hypothetical protein